MFETGDLKAGGIRVRALRVELERGLDLEPVRQAGAGVVEASLEAERLEAHTGGDQLAARVVETRSAVVIV